MTNFNQVMNEWAYEQCIVPGSPLWVGGGLKLDAHATGGHPDYGWRKNGLVGRLAVIANYACRRVFYFDQPERSGDYDMGGRPIGWVIEKADDMTDGSYVQHNGSGFLTINGIDREHFSINGVFALFDETPPDHPDRLRVEWLLRGLVAANVGQFRDKSKAHGVTDYFCSGRAMRHLLFNAVRAAKRGMLSPGDAATVLAYLEFTLVPRLEAPPKEFVGQKGGFGQVYNGYIGWGLPALYDVFRMLPNGALRTCIGPIVVRYSRYVADLEQLVPGHGDGVESFDITPGIVKGEGGQPVESLLPHLTAANVHFAKRKDGSDDKGLWRPWNYRSRDVADRLTVETLEGPHAKALADLRGTGNETWLVDANGEYVV